MKALVCGWWFHLSFEHVLVSLVWSIIGQTMENSCRFVKSTRIRTFLKLYFFPTRFRVDGVLNRFGEQFFKQCGFVSQAWTHSFRAEEVGHGPQGIMGRIMELNACGIILHRILEQCGSAVFPNISCKKCWIALGCLFFLSFCLVHVLYSQKWRCVFRSVRFSRTIHRRLKSNRWLS